MALNQFLFGDLGFVGNARDYYDRATAISTK